MSWIDVSKGIGICLVVFGHCIFPSHELINVFHMPLFFFLAGITFHHKDLISFFSSKCNRIFIPYIFWFSLSYILQYIPHPYSGPFNGPLWFLPTLLFALIIMQFITYMSCKWQLCVNAIFIIILFLMNSPDAHFKSVATERAIIAYFYLRGGYSINSLLTSHSNKKNKYIPAIAYITLFVGVFVYLIHRGFSGDFVNLTIYDNDCLIVCLCSILGIMSVISIAHIFCNNKILIWLGCNSLVIMCVHFPFCQIMNVYLSSLRVYETIQTRILMMICEWCVALLISSLFVIICKLLIPRLTGYLPLIHLKKYAVSDSFHSLL